MNYLLSITFLTIIINVSIQIGTGYRYIIPRDILAQVICSCKITHFLNVVTRCYIDTIFLFILDGRESS